MTEFSFFGSGNAPRDFNEIKISIVSPERIREWSSGEVVKPDTVNYRTIKPENGDCFVPVFLDL